MIKACSAWEKVGIEGEKIRKKSCHDPLGIYHSFSAGQHIKRETSTTGAKKVTLLSCSLL